MLRRKMIIVTLALAAAAQAVAACTEARSGRLQAAAMSASSPSDASAPAAPESDDDDYSEREESRQSYRLAPGSRVEINSVSGHVTIKTGESDAAEVHIVRSARKREDLRCREFNVQATERSLRLDGNDSRRECRNVQVRQNLEMRLPRRVNLEVTSVSGHVNVGALDGSVHLTSISGHATVEQAAGEASFTSISGHVGINLSRVEGRGVRMNSISGNIDVGLPAGANAEFRVSSISGEVISDVPGLEVRKVGPANFEGRIGSGGTEMTFNSISGNVRFRRTD
jgi:DUF4097 and DUF4098 domain-containing protein YvlB